MPRITDDLGKHLSVDEVIASRRVRGFIQVEIHPDIREMLEKSLGTVLTQKDLNTIVNHVMKGITDGTIIVPCE